MFNIKKPLFFLIFFLLVFSNITVYINAEDLVINPEPFIYHYPPINSFGIQSWKTVNWTYFNNCFTYETNAEELEIEWNKTDDSVSKFKYKFKTYVYDLYYLNISFIDNYIDDIFYIGNYTLELLYPDGSMFFNFTDIIDTTSFEYDFILYDNGFKLILSSFLDVDEWEIDPSFGYSSTGSSSWLYYASTQPYYNRGPYAMMGSCDGVAVNMTTYIHTIGEETTIKGWIYNYTDYSSSYAGTKVGETYNLTIDVGDQGSEVVMTFVGSPSLSKDTNYYLLVGCTDSSISTNLKIARVDTPNSNIYKTSTGTPVVMNDPLTGETSTSGRDYVYVTYTEDCGGCADECYINESSESPVNGTTGLSPCSYINSTIWVDGSCGLINWTNISVVGVGYNNFTTQSNGTFYYNNTNPSCSTTYTWWCNSSCNGSVNSSYYTYSTWNCCDTTIENVSNSTLLNYDYNLTYVNLTSLCVNSSCNTTLEWLNISVVGQNYTNNSAISEGCSLSSNTNVTGLNLSCNTDYRVFINVSSDNCSGSDFNSTYIWLNTSDCVTNVTNISCCDCFNDTCFLNSLENYLTTNNYIQEDDTVEIELTDNFLSIFLTLVLFLLFFIYGYTVEKRSAGAFLMFSGFILLSLEYLTASYLHSITIALLGVFAIFIIVLGVRKWLFPVDKKKVKTEEH